NRRAATSPRPRSRSASRPPARAAAARWKPPQTPSIRPAARPARDPASDGFLHVLAQRPAVAVAAIQPDADRARDHEEKRRERKAVARAHLDAAAGEREHHGLRDVAKQRAEQEGA